MSNVAMTNQCPTKQRPNGGWWPLVIGVAASRSRVIGHRLPWSHPTAPCNPTDYLEVWSNPEGCPRLNIERWMFARFVLLLLTSLILVQLLPAAAQSPVVATNSLRPDFWDADGPIHALAARDGVVFVGGEFSYVAPRGRKVAAVDAYTAETIREFPNV